MGISSVEDVDHPFFKSYLDSCILLESREYNHLEVWALINVEYVSRLAKESSFRSLVHRLIHRLVASTIHHHEDHDKISLGDLVSMWCLLRSDVHLIIP